MIMLALTFALGLLAVLASWRGITERVGAFHFVLLWTVAGLAGVFLALDLFLFYFFWEMMLVPMYFLIAVWGHERRVYAAIKFFLFTQVSGLLMLVAILGLYFIHGRATGRVHVRLHRAARAPSWPRRTALLLMLGFFAAFAVKLPALPLHTWLPDAHTEAPTAGSVILAGLLLKTGAYGLIRFVVPLFPDAVAEFAPLAMALGVAGILYGAVHGLRADRPQAAGRLHEREPHGLRAARHLRLEHARPAGRGDADGLPRPLHGRPLHPRRGLQERMHTRDLGAHGRPLAGRRRAWAAWRCSSRWPRWGCPAWATSSASS